MTVSSEHEIKQGPEISVAALLGADFPGLHPTLVVSEGDRVTAGDVLFHDRDRPKINFVSPISGAVGKLEFGARHALSVLKIHRNETTQDDGQLKKTPATDDPRATLLERGFWPAFRTRPFAHIPDPAAEPDAIFVDALHGDPTAPDPRVLIQDRAEQFQCGIEILGRLTKGSVHICQPTGPDIIPNIGGNVVATPFTNRRHPIHIGTCIHNLFSARLGREIWTIGCQDVIAIGHLFETGQYLSDRIVSLNSVYEKNPRQVKTVMGASIADLIEEFPAGPTDKTSVRILSGSPQTGREAAFVGRYHQQVSVIETTTSAARPPLRAPFNRIHNRNGPRPIIPFASLNSALPFDIPTVPLMRALSIADVEAAEDLGCLELIEEDVAHLSQICASGADYGALLRQVLDELDTEN